MMEPSHAVVSRPERITLELVQDLDRSAFARTCVVAGPARLPRSLTSRLTRELGFDVTDVLPETPGSEQRGAHLLIRAAVDDYASAGAKAGRHLDTERACDVVLGSATPEQARVFTHALVTSTQLRAGRQPTRDPDDQQRVVRLWCPGRRQRESAHRAAQLALRVLSARRIANEPGNLKTPAWLTAAAQLLVERSTVRRHDEPWLKRHGFGGVLAVGAGSAERPNVTVIQHGRDHPGPHVVLVGKGITFDSGGLSLKPAAAMPLMKTDMSGAAALIGAIGAAADLDLPIRVTGILGCAENLPSGSAMRPGDVVRHVGGRTTEIRNTDAEGRLVLADCLAYASRTLAPDYLIDVATLTGAATVGLGRGHAALYSTDRRLLRSLVAAGRRSGDPVWPMPLVPEYLPAIDSDVADAANANTDAHTGAGSVTAALFLQPFASGSRWAHLDIAGPGRTESDRPDCRIGATGFGVSLMTHWLARVARRRL